MNPVNLSVCYIVRDEAEFLERSLESVKEVANEIIVVDTGSVDNSIKVAQKFGAEIHQHPWHNDFAEARNACLKLSLGSWILYLDADERLTTPDELLKLIEEPKDIGYIVTVISKYSGSGHIDYSPQIRLFRNNSAVRFTGRVHEQAFPSLKKLEYDFIECGVAIDHVGYNCGTSVLRYKAKRNLDILLVEGRLKGFTPLRYFQIAQCYGLLGNNELAVSYLERVLFSPGKLSKEYLETTRDSLNKLYPLLPDRKRKVDASGKVITIK